MTAVIIIIIVAALIGFAVLGGIAAKKRRESISAWARSKGLSFNSAKEYGIENHYPQFSHLRQGSNRYAYNVCQGEIAGRHLEVF